GRLPGPASGAGDHLSLQTAALFSAVEETPYSQAVPATGATLSYSRLSVAPGRVGSTSPARPDSLGLVGGDRPHVALHPQQRHHRGLSQQNGTHQPASLWLPKLPKLQTQSEGVMFLEISLGSGFAPVVGVEPFLAAISWQEAAKVCVLAEREGFE